MVASPRTEALVALRLELDETADALRRADLSRLLASETRLQTVLAALASSSALNRGDAVALKELRSIQASLTRCRRLGTAMTSFIDVSFPQLRDEPVTHTFQHSA